MLILNSFKVNFKPFSPHNGIKFIIFDEFDQKMRHSGDFFQIWVNLYQKDIFVFFWIFCMRKTLMIRDNRQNILLSLDDFWYHNYYKSSGVGSTSVFVLNSMQFPEEKITIVSICMSLPFQWMHYTFGFLLAQL